MLFVDGENLTFRAQRWAKGERNLQPIEGEYYVPHVFIWMPDFWATTALTNRKDLSLAVQPNAIRSYYYTSLIGDTKKLMEVKKSLWNLGFQPEVFKKTRQRQKTKGVDLTLAKDFLSNAYYDHYDVAVLIAGDADYVPVVSEVKRLGKVVYVVFFHGKGFGLSEQLELSSDRSFDFGQLFREKWAAFIDKQG